MATCKYNIHPRGGFHSYKVGSQWCGKDAHYDIKTDLGRGVVSVISGNRYCRKHANIEANKHQRSVTKYKNRGGK